MLMALFLIGIGVAMAQTQVQGTIVDEQGEPVIGASVLVKGTTTGTVTNIDGEFALSAPSNGTLVISYVGMQTMEVAVSPRIRVILRSDAELLDEVVVTGYGTFKKLLHGLGSDGEHGQAEGRARDERVGQAGR